MFVVIEGLDRTGKTTLAKQLERTYDLLYVHFSKPQDHPLDEYGRKLNGTVTPPHVVADRYHWGETVWPHVFKRPTDYDAPMHHWIELLLESRGAVMVHATREVEAIIRACVADGEPIQGRQIYLADDLFNLAAMYSLLPVVNYEQGDEIAVNLATSLAQTREVQSAKLLATNSRVIGHLEPNVLLVGDVAGPVQSTEGKWTLPFVPYRGTSGHFLMNELRQDHMRSVRPLIVNAHQPNEDFEDVNLLHDHLGRPPVVALGLRASETLKAQGVPHKKIFHPQYVRRFLRKEGNGFLGNLIKESM
jgi:hypothetical protein